MVDLSLKSAAAVLIFSLVTLACPFIATSTASEELNNKIESNDDTVPDNGADYEPNLFNDGLGSHDKNNINFHKRLTKVDAGNENVEDETSILKGKGNNLILGHESFRDRQLMHLDVYVPSKLWQRVTKVIVYPGSELPPDHVITAVYALDKKTDGTGALPEVVNGGVGQRSVAIKLTSRRNHGIYFLIKIFGHKV